MKYQNFPELRVIIDPLKEIYAEHRINNGSVSEYTKSAQAITKEWQNIFSEKNSGNCNIYIEQPISTTSKEKIDLVDTMNKIAFELKVSGKNVKHEFYKDLFKVQVYNVNNPTGAVNTFVFISEHNGIKRLVSSDLFKETLKLLDIGNNTLKSIKLVGVSGDEVQLYISHVISTI